MIAVIERRAGLDRAIVEFDIRAELDGILLRAALGETLLIHRHRNQNQNAFLLRHRICLAK